LPQILLAGQEAVVVVLERKTAQAVLAHLVKVLRVVQVSAHFLVGAGALELLD
jgi:hypothetical protein